jgi:hypothetical protein
MSIAEVITLCIAVIGALLGVINTFHILNRDRIKLEVKPVLLMATFGPVAGVGTIGITVINLSFVPVTVKEVGFVLPENKVLVPLQPWTTDGGPYPRKLEPRTSFTVGFSEQPSDITGFEKALCAFAKTACGIKFKGTSPAFKQAVREA